MMTPTTKHPLTTPALGMALVGALTLTACGDDSESSTSFCDAATSYVAANNAPNPSTASPAELETTFEELRDALDGLSSAAPAEIKADVDTVSGVFGDFIDAFAAHDYDYAQLMADPASQAAVDALSSDELGTATGNIDDYIAAQCDTVSTEAG